MRGPKLLPSVASRGDTSSRASKEAGFRDMHRAEVKAPFLDSSFQRAPEACSPDPIFTRNNEDLFFKTISLTRAKMLFLQQLYVLAPGNPRLNKKAILAPHTRTSTGARFIRKINTASRWEIPAGGQGLQQ